MVIFYAYIADDYSFFEKQLHLFVKKYNNNFNTF